MASLWRQGRRNTRRKQTLLAPSLQCTQQHPASIELRRTSEIRPGGLQSWGRRCKRPVSRTGISSRSTPRFHTRRRTFGFAKRNTDIGGIDSNLPNAVRLTDSRPLPGSDSRISRFDRAPNEGDVSPKAKVARSNRVGSASFFNTLDGGLSHRCFN
jgi:hypothetical protein